MHISQKRKRKAKEEGKAKGYVWSTTNWNRRPLVEAQMTLNLSKWHRQNRSIKQKQYKILTHDDVETSKEGAEKRDEREKARARALLELEPYVPPCAAQSPPTIMKICNMYKILILDNIGVVRGVLAHGGARAKAAMRSSLSAGFGHEETSSKTKAASNEDALPSLALFEIILELAETMSSWWSASFMSTSCSMGAIEQRRSEWLSINESVERQKRSSKRCKIS